MNKNLHQLFLVFCFFLSLNTMAQVFWVSRFNGQGDFSARFSVIKTDAFGQLYLGGYSINPGDNKDILIVKLNNQGDTVFTRQINGIGNNSDDITDMAIDGLGNVYATGFIWGAGTSADMFTLKMDSLGNILWNNIYSYSAYEYDQGNSIYVDGAGNVYVTGQVDSDPSCITNEDIVTIKYDSNGNQLWIAFKNGLGNGTDKPVKVVADNSGNAYVAGRTFNGINDDYIIIKYNLSGSEQWVQYYDRNHNDKALDMAIDNSNNFLYVTGRSNSGVNFDYATLKYDFNGVLQWSKIFDYLEDDRASNIALDGSGNIYVSGESDQDATPNQNFDITTVKYDAAGNLQWSRSFGGASNTDDNPNNMVVTASGDVLIAGRVGAIPGATIIYDGVLLKYDASGTIQWSKIINGSSSGDDDLAGVAVDGSGNVSASGFSETTSPQRNGVMFQYNSAGTALHTYNYNSIGDQSDNSHGIYVDNTGNSYIAGYTVSWGQDRNFATFKLNTAGDTLWTRQINGSSTGSEDEAYDITTDATGNVYVTGWTKNSCQASDITTVKYSSLGDSLWEQVYNDPVISGTDRAYAIGLDGMGNVYVTGKTDKDASVNYNYDIITIKYNNSGIQQWVSTYSGSGAGEDEARLIHVTSAGNVYVSGRTYNGTNQDAIIIKYNNAGTQQWVSTYSGVSGDDAALSMAVDANENIYISGFITTVSNGRDLFVAKFNSSGVQQWAQIYNGTTNGNEEGKSITLDSNGNIYVAGYTDTDADTATLNNDYLLLKYGNAGNFQWVKNYDGLNGANDEANAVTSDANGNVIVTGQSDNGSPTFQNYDFLTLFYDSSGNLLTDIAYNGTANNSDVANTLFYKNGFLYVTGGSYGPVLQRDMVTIKYDVQTILGVSESQMAQKDLYVYPNPSNGIFKVGFSQKYISNDQKLVITDVTGGEIESYELNGRAETSCDLRNLSSGFYLISIVEADRTLATRKLLIN